MTTLAVKMGSPLKLLRMLALMAALAAISITVYSCPTSNHHGDHKWSGDGTGHGRD